MSGAVPVVGLLVLIVVVNAAIVLSAPPPATTAPRPADRGSDAERVGA